jgi:hypothetical protein
MNDLEIQRIVDGECDHESLARWLSSLGDNDPQWRTLALRLLEEQAMRKLFRADSQASPRVMLPSAPQKASQSSRVGRQSWLFAASVIFMVIGLSSFYRSLRNSGESSNAIAQSNADIINRELPTADASRSPATSNSPSSAVIHSVATQAGPVGKMRWQSAEDSDTSIELPIYEVSEIAPEMIFGDSVKQIVDLNSKLNRRGWAADLDTQIYEGELEDGRRMMVPVNFVRFQSIGY